MVRDKRIIMAISDEIRHQRKKLKGKGVKAHISYFFTYYTWATVGIIAGILFVGSLIINIVNNKEQALSVIMLNASTMAIGSDDYADTLEADYAAYVGIDTDQYSVVIDVSTYQTPGVVYDSYDLSTSQKISVQTAAQTLDAVVADASNFYYYSYSLAFDDLRNVLPEETLERYKDHIYYVDLAEVNAYQEEVESAASTDGPMTVEEGEAYEQIGTFVQPDPDEMEEPVPVGIIVTDAPQIADSGAYTDTVVIYGIMQNATHVENAASFLDYLWQ